MTTTVDVGATVAAELHSIECVACGGTDGTLLLSPAAVRAEQLWLRRFHDARAVRGGGDAKDRSSFTQSDDRSVVACRSCGTVLRLPRPSPEESEATYARDEYGDEALQQLAENQDAFFAAKLDRLAPHFAQLDEGAAPVLEIGSFVGGFLNAASRRGWHATGVDVGEETTRFARERGFAVLEEDVLELDRPAASFDAVFVWSTFDQLSEPAAVLDRVAELLRPGGLLVLRVPNGRFEIACLELRGAAPGTRRVRTVLCAQAYNNFVSFPYLTGYTPESLCGLLAAHGFACERLFGDTILRLADDETLPFAVAEEARLKRAVRRACRAAERTTGLLFDPWLDVIARRGGAS